MSTALPIIRDDKSGGFLVITGTDGSLRHNFRVHVPPFASVPASNANVVNDYRYNTIGTGQEATVGETGANLIAILQQLFPTPWRFNFQSLWRNSAPGVGGGVITRQRPTPGFGPKDGLNAGSFAYHAGQITFSLPTHGMKRGKLIVLGSQAWLPTGIPETIFGDPAGNNLAKLVAYLGGMVLTDTSWLVFTTAWPTTQIVGHDGTPMYPEANLTYSLNRRLRRTYGYIGDKYNMRLA